jgi:cation:H+ antiporter
MEPVQGALMTVSSAAYLFVASVVLMTISSFVLSGSLETLKIRFHVSGGLLGMLAALGAATPEISSAATALFAKQHDVGVGIIIGSNIFNLAALLGLCALLAGRLPLRRQAMIFNGAISLIVTLVLILLVFGFISAPLSVVLLVLLLVPYAIVSGLKPSQMKRWRLPAAARTVLTEAFASTRQASGENKAAMPKSWSWAWMGGAALIVIIVTCMGMVRSAVVLSDAWGLNKTILGVLVLAFFTGIPDVVTAIKLALAGRGTAVMSEALNSNTLNILFGICVPATVFGIGTLAGQTLFSVWWLLGITAINLCVLYWMKGFTRMSGALSVGLYLVFAAVVIGWQLD